MVWFNVNGGNLLDDLLVGDRLFNGLYEEHWVWLFIGYNRLFEIAYPNKYDHLTIIRIPW